MKLNIVNIKNENVALVSIVNNNKQQLTVDANFLIPPDRSEEVKQGIIRAYSFEKFKSIWIEPLLTTFSNITIHEAVYGELHSYSHTYIYTELKEPTPRITVLEDSKLTEPEKIVRDTIEEKIAKNTQYNPVIDNKDDRGEVKSLAYIATKGLPYFCSHDSNAIRLIEKADELDTNLQAVGAVKTYEIIYYLLRAGKGNAEGLRSMYRYMYHLTKSDKAVNPAWGEFVEQMDKLYKDYIDSVLSEK